MTANINNVQLCQLKYFTESNGDLVVIEGGEDIPFSIARVFVVRAESGAIRGCHAHRNCGQFLTCSFGKVHVICSDGNETSEFQLEKPDLGLFIPSGIWASQTYKDKESVLTVLCDRRYEESDYIRDYDEFLAYRGSVM